MVVRSRAQMVSLDPDQNGKPRTSIVIVPEDAADAALAPQGGRPAGAAPLLIEVLRAAIETRGEYFVPDGKVPLQAADQEVVRELFYRRYIDAEEDTKRSASARRKAFKRAIDMAVEREIIGGQRTDDNRQLLWFRQDEGILQQ